MRGERSDHPLVCRELLVLGRRARSLQEEELGSEQTDAPGAERDAASLSSGVPMFARRETSVPSRVTAGSVASTQVAFVAAVRPASAPASKRLVVASSGSMKTSPVAPSIASSPVARASRQRERLEQVAHADDRGDAVGAREDRGMRGRRRTLEHDAEESLARQGRGQRGRKVVGDDDRRPIEPDRRLTGPGESSSDPIADVDDIRGPRGEELVVEGPKLLGERVRPPPGSAPIASSCDPLIRSVAIVARAGSRAIAA